MIPSFRAPTLLGFAVLLLLPGAFSPEPPPSSGDTVADLPSNPSAPDPDPEILEEIERGRYWHAARLLDGQGSDPATLLVRARAEAGWGNWAGAWEALSAVEGLAETGPEARVDVRALRARAAEETGRLDEAASGYRRALEGADAVDPARAAVLRIRLARVLAKDGRAAEALELLDRIVESDPGSGSWLALELARTAASEGDVESARGAVEAIADAELRDRAWNVLPEAHLAATDTGAAVTALLDVARSGIGERARAEAWSRLAEIHLARGDTADARERFRGSFALTPGAAAARGLVATGLDDPDRALAAHRVLRGAGDGERALEALERHLELREESGPPSDELRLGRARLLLRAARLDEASDELAELASRTDPEIAGPALDLQAEVRRRQGRAGDARTLQERLVERFPERPEAVDVVFFRADGRHDGGDLDAALEGYRRVVEMRPSLDRAGLARMRAGQIHVTRGDHEAAARTFDGYLEAFPDGRRWQEASYWSARSHLALGRSDSARALVRRVVEEDPLSYYAVLGSQLLDRPFAPPVEDGTEPPPVPEIDEELDRIDRLRDAGLDAAVPGRVRDLVRRFESSPDTLLRLALELGKHGFGSEGISTAWRAVERGRERDRWVARALYPFPYRELVRLEAEEWGLDPFELAALIRQESAFVPGARSPAGALGLMQVIPGTGEDVARRVGPDGFSAPLLLRAEVNLHLGSAFLSELHERFDGRDPMVLAAYNAGPSRVRRWESGFPEAEDPLRFTERIPYAETRAYVKRVVRNVHVYRWLYSEQDPAGDRSIPAGG